MLRSRFKLAGVGFVFLWFFIGGIAHFAATETEMRIVPAYIPWPRAAVLVSGVFELLGAVGLLWHPTRRAAGIGHRPDPVDDRGHAVPHLHAAEARAVPGFLVGALVAVADPGCAVGTHCMVHDAGAAICECVELLEADLASAISTCGRTRPCGVRRLHRAL